MIDTHYDLLTICYLCYLKNDYTKIEEISKEISTSGVTTIFANLYFMTKEEMKEELGENYYRESIPVLDMFKISKTILKKYLPNTNFIYSIEGCDYISILDLEPLYKEGLRSIILVWNNENQYGSGIRSNKGLTKLGKSFIQKAIDLNIGIDLSHANEPTFNDIINIIRKNQLKEKTVICYASHSNSKTLCNISRNLTDNQLLKLKQVNGLVGLLSNKTFVTKNNNLDKYSLKQEYLKHIQYIANIIGIDKVMLSTDDMRFLGSVDKLYLERPIYEYKSITKDIEETLSKIFSKKDIEKILYKNAYDQIIKKLNL